MDQEMNELKELVRQNIALTQETNKMVHSMRNTSRWSFIFRLVWWVAIIGISGVSYYLFVAPYVSTLLELYDTAQQSIQTLQNSGAMR